MRHIFNDRPTTGIQENGSFFLFLFFTTTQTAVTHTPQEELAHRNTTLQHA